MTGREATSDGRIGLPLLLYNLYACIDGVVVFSMIGASY